MIYVAKNHRGLIVGIVNAESKKLAVAYWQGDRLEYDTITDNVGDPSSNGTGVIPILKTKTTRFNDEKVGEGTVIILK